MRKWLKAVGTYSHDLLGCTYLYGCLSPETREMVTMRNQTIEARMRSMLLCVEWLIFILGYSKTTAPKGQDQMSVHALPARLTYLHVILSTLDQPVAVQWVKELCDGTETVKIPTYDIADPTEEPVDIDGVDDYQETGAPNYALIQWRICRLGTRPRMRKPSMLCLMAIRTLPVQVLSPNTLGPTRLCMHGSTGSTYPETKRESLLETFKGPQHS